MYKLIVTVFVLFTGVYGSFFRKDYTYIESEEAFYKLHRVRANFWDAALRCRLEGSKLFMPKTKDIAKKLLEIIRTKDKFNYMGSYLVGLHATISENDYFTLDGEPLSELDSWNEQVQFQNQTNSKGEAFSCMTLDAETKLVNSDCQELYPFVCFHKCDYSVVFTKCGPSNNGYEYYNETDACYKFHRVARPYHRAFMACSAEGAKLANIYSDAERRLLVEIYKNNPDNTMPEVSWSRCAFVGMSDWGEHGEYVTNDGDPLSTTAWKWHANEPNNSTTGEFCAGVYDSGELNDLWCDRPSPFICKMTPNALQRSL